MWPGVWVSLVVQPQDAVGGLVNRVIEAEDSTQRVCFCVRRRVCRVTEGMTVALPETEGVAGGAVQNLDEVVHRGRCCGCAVWLRVLHQFLYRRSGPKSWLLMRFRKHRRAYGGGLHTRPTLSAAPEL